MQLSAAVSDVVLNARTLLVLNDTPINLGCTSSSPHFDIQSRRRPLLRPYTYGLHPAALLRYGPGAIAASASAICSTV
jgi:hypothetical protein